ncbi:MAG: TonB-dependent receptor [Proteobacteria bacterium]|nr:TonB-dependent receptor [Pseudomonadota bacterium]
MSRISRPRVCVGWPVAALLALAICAPARAHDEDEGSRLAPEAIEEILVTSQRHVTASFALTVPAREFELRPLESGGQMIEAVPGAMTAQHTGGGKAEQYFIRGFDADHGTDLAVYFDGVPVNLRSHAHGQGYLDLHFVSRETIERLVGTKGPYLPRYGDFGTAATIEYVPYRRVEESSVEFEAGAWDTFRLFGLWSPRSGAFGGADPDARGYLSFEAYGTDGPFREAEDLRRYSLFGRGEVRLSPDLRLSGHLLAYSADWNASGLIPERRVKSGDLSRLGSLDPSEGGETSRLQGKLQLDWRLAENRLLVASAYLASYELEMFSNFTYALADPHACDGIVQRDGRVYAGGRVEYQQFVALPWPSNLHAGLEWRYDDARVRLGHQTRRRVTGFARDHDIRELSLGPYLELEVFPLEWVRFIGGLRLERAAFDVDSRLAGGGSGSGDDTLWLPKANWILSPFGEGSPWVSENDALRGLELFLNFGVGFHSNDARSGLLDERILTRAPGAEIGVRTRLFDRVTFSLGGFWLGLEDELVFVGDEGTTESAGRSRRLGVEFVARADLSERFYLRGDLTYTSARLTRGDVPVPQATRFIAKAALGVRAGNWVAELGLRSLGDRYAGEDFRNPRLSGYTVLDLGARHRRSPWEFGLAIENLTGTRWRSSEFHYASCALSERGAVPACPAALALAGSAAAADAPSAAAEGIDDFHFTPGNPRNLRVWLRYRF